ncbi:virulence RhuM family protein [Patescibacteria group bacterium]|nr:virulence RhuM family protein [Patescibacteria group bacterium]MBU1674050.1 virulence RhuM family protein [Patescibacteria group bacterium]MBU1963198.1 virulence RhuM family protein [Patescibacteria group bacterium]
MSKNKQRQLIIYQGKNGAIEFRGDFDRDTIWGNLNQIADLFGVQKAAISKHLSNIYKEKELDKKTTVSILETIQTEGNRTVKRNIDFYNLDVIISVGYRVNSKNATQFRIWATKVLKQHLIQGYTINKKQVSQNYENFIKAVSDVKALLPAGNNIKTEDILELINAFANTWFSLSAYDTDKFPKKGATKKKVIITANELDQALQELKQDLITKKQATDLFAQVKTKDAVEGIVGNVMQAAFGKDLYPTAEEKAAHLLYFMVKNHPFTDGNKRSGAFSFIWFLRKTGLLRASLTPEALTALTLLIAESQPRDKDKMIGLVLLLLNK